jgi:hypothetical protein
VKAAFVGLLAAVAPAAAAASPPRVAQLVVYRNGGADQGLVKAAGTNVRVGSKRCAVPAGTSLAALLHSGLPGIQLKDYGSCSRRPADAGGLYVRRIRGDRAKGVNGWVYKVGNKAGSAGAGDPSGAFGSGRLKNGARVTWFYCRMKANGCQRTLAIKPKVLGGGAVRVTVKAYDDQGKARPAARATVYVGTVTAKADAHGVAMATGVEPGRRFAHAEAKGDVRSFGEEIDVR